MPPTPPPALPPITLFGFPFESTGRAEHIRAIWRALAAAGVAAKVYNLRPERPSHDEELKREFGPHLTEEMPGGIRLFHLNGDEVPIQWPALVARHPGGLEAGHNIIYPAWELPNYPALWARDLERFNEVWAASDFVDSAIRPAVRVPVMQIPNACTPYIAAPLTRAHLAIPDNRFVVLFFLDAGSYQTRKNPQGVIEAFRRLLVARPGSDVHLVLKLNHTVHAPALPDEIRAAVAPFADRVTLIDATMTANEAKNLVRLCDCFLSLHRSEGFGRGPAEAMFLGKPAIATGWSGNMEYMRPECSFPLRYTLIPVGANQYPFWEDQVWAEPDVEQAAVILTMLVDDPALARAVGERARAHMLANFSDAVLGARYRARFAEIAARM